MNRNICIFEDSNYINLLPLVYTRAVYELKCGMDSLLNNIVRHYPDTAINLLCRDYIADTLKEGVSYPVNPVRESSSSSDSRSKLSNGVNESKWSKDGVLFINGRLLMQSPIPIEGNEEVGIKNNQVVYARLKNCSAIDYSYFLSNDLMNKLKVKIKFIEVEGELINYSWDLVHHNPSQIGRDFKAIAKKGKICGEVYKGAILVNEADIFIGEGSKVKPGAVLDAENGPIYIGKNVTVSPNSTIEGPAFIGDGAKINIGAKIREGTSIGEGCKVGGEVEESIIHSFSNKQHDGFLGHAYIGMWVNLGADTNNSDLKNNYGNVKVWVNDKLIDSGSMFVGLTMGDHSKAGINTMFNTGTVVGTCANVFGAGFPPKFVPSFSWGGPNGMVIYDPAKGIEVARRVMARRKKDLSSAGGELLGKVFELTREERKSAGVSEGKALE